MAVLNAKESTPTITRPSALRPTPVKYEDTLRAAVEACVQKAAQRLSTRLYGSRERDPQTGRLLWFGIDKVGTQARVRTEVWHLDEGKALMELARSRYAVLEKGEALRRIESDPKLRRTHAVAVGALRNGIDLG